MAHFGLGCFTTTEAVFESVYVLNCPMFFFNVIRRFNIKIVLVLICAQKYYSVHLCRCCFWLLLCVWLKVQAVGSDLSYTTYGLFKVWL